MGFGPSSRWGTQVLSAKWQALHSITALTPKHNCAGFATLLVSEYGYSGKHETSCDRR